MLPHGNGEREDLGAGRPGKRRRVAAAVGLLAVEHDESKSPQDHVPTSSETSNRKISSGPRGLHPSRQSSGSGASGFAGAGIKIQPPASGAGTGGDYGDDEEEEEDQGEDEHQDGEEDEDKDEDDYDDDDDDDEAEQEGGQKFLERATGPGANLAGAEGVRARAAEMFKQRLKYPDPGTIKSLTLTNFMCHGNLHVDLKPNVNCIVGQNGSGKSSICAGIMLAFNCKVASTGRGSSMASIVKHGCSEAKIELVLHNASGSGSNTSPQEPYRHDTFGDTIKITRRLRRAAGGGGSSNFFVDGKRSSCEQVRGREAKEEIEQLKRHFQVDPSNPLMVLTQEEAKRFAIAKGKERYELFLRATQLQSAQDNMVAVHERITRMKQDQPLLEADKMKAQTAFSKAEGKWRIFEGMKTLDDKIIQAKHDLEFAKLALEKEVLEEQHASLDNARDRTLKLEGKIVKSETSKSELEDRMAEGANELEQLEKNQQQRAAEVEELTSRSNQVMVPLTECRKKIKKYGDQREALLDRAADSRKQIADLRAKLGQTDFQARLEALHSQAESQRAQLEDIEAEAHDAQEAVDVAQKQAGAFSKSAKSSFDASKTLQERVQDVQDQLKRLEDRKMTGFDRRVAALDTQGAALKSYRSIVKLMAEIKQPMPVGPIGAFIKLKDASKRSALSSVLNDVLFEYRVTSTRFNSQLRRAAPKIAVSTARRTLSREDLEKRLSSTRIKPKRGDSIVTLHDLMEFSGGSEEGALIAEQVVLGSRNTQRVLVAQDSRIGRNLLERYPEASSVVLDDGSTIRRSGKGFQFSNVGRTADANFSQSVEEQRVQLEAALQAASEELEATEAALTVAQSNLERAKTKLDRARSQQKQLAGKRGQLQRALNKTKAAEKSVRDEEQRNGDEELQNRIEGIESDVERYEERATKLKALEAQQREKERDLEDKLRPIKEQQKHLRAMQSNDGDMQRIMNKMERVTDQLQQVQSKLRQREAKLDQERKAIAETMQTCATLQASYDAKMETVQAASGRSTFQGDCVTVTEAEAAIVQHQRAKDRIARAEGHDPAAIDKARVAYETAKAHLQFTTERVDRCIQLAKSTSKTNLRRFKHIKKMFHKLSDATSEAFAQTLLKKGHAGRLAVIADDRKNPIAGGRMELVVTPNVYQLSQSEYKQVMQSQQGTGLQDDDEDADAGDDSEKKKKRDAKVVSTTDSLSGGEKALTSLSLLLAIGEQLELPWRAMDEFDVFMDEQTRKLALNAILETAFTVAGNSDKTGHQFILITPLDTSSADTKAFPDGFVNTFKLKAPKRTQTMEAFVQRGGGAAEAAAGGGDIDL